MSHLDNVPFPAVVVDVKYGRDKSDVCLVDTPVGKQTTDFLSLFKEKVAFVCMNMAHDV